MTKRHCRRHTKTDVIITQKYSPNTFLPELLDPADEGTTILQNIEKYPVTKRNISEYSNSFFSVNESILERISNYKLPRKISKISF